MDAVFHITTRTAWEKAKAEGKYTHPSLQAEGFLHCAWREQVLGVANTLYRGRDDLVMLQIATDRLESRIQDDCTESGAIYPHVYGPINLDSVTAVADLRSESDGAFVWPLTTEEGVPNAVGNIAAGNEAAFPDLLA